MEGVQQQKLSRRKGRAKKKKTDDVTGTIFSKLKL
jgi:hypothetical protein